MLIKLHKHKQIKPKNKTIEKKTHIITYIAINYCKYKKKTF